MFGMSSTDFWENDPQLYWAYRTFYLKKCEMDTEQMEYEAWFKGSMNYLAVSTAIANALSKQKTNYPSYEELFSKEDKKETKEVKKMTEEEADIYVQEQNIWWNTH